MCLQCVCFVLCCLVFALIVDLPSVCLLVVWISS